MKLAVKLYRDAENAPVGMPPIWPAEVRELSDDAIVEAPYIEMNVEQYEAYCAEHLESFRQYLVSYPPSNPSVYPDTVSEGAAQ